MNANRLSGALNGFDI